MARSRDTSVARQVLVLQIVVVLVLVVSAVALAAYDARSDARDRAGARAVAIARAVADSPTVVDGVEAADPTAILQPYAEQVRADTDVSFVVVMRTDRTRLTHPTTSLIGKPFQGGLGTAPEGGSYTEEFTGTLGDSIRSVVPVTDDGQVVALVSVGVALSSIDRSLRRDLTPIGLAALAVLGVGLAGTWLVARRLRRATHGLGAAEITRMYEYYAAVLHAVREGLLLLDGTGRVQLANDEAHRLLGLPDDAVGRDLRDLGLAPALVATALDPRASEDEVYLAGERVLLVSSAPATWDGREVGAVVSLRDSTELRTVTGELDVTRGLSESLRAQSHEAANRLHTVVSLIEMGRPQEAVDFVTDELHLAQLLTDRVVEAVDEPVVVALLLGKSAEAAERGVALEVTGELPVGAVGARDLVTVLGNLIDNAVDAVTGDPRPDAGPRRVRIALAAADDVRLVVEDSGPGLSDDEASHVFERGWSTKAAGATGRGIGLALVSQVARGRGGRVEVDRSELGGARFTVVLPRTAAVAT